jgi:TetR/AcrR family transcriptional repressor of nem operon
MRYDEDHKQKTRAKVLSVAARAIRADGPDRIGVAAIMAEAGLTHGGFYAHFASKEDLIAEAIGQMFLESQVKMEAHVAGKAGKAALEAYINFYFSRAHRDGRDSGCPLPALSADLPRLPDRARQRFGEGVEGMRRRLAGWLSEIGKAAPEALATSTLAEMVGAVTLARAVADRGQSDAMLKISRAALRARLGLDDDHE